MDPDQMNILALDELTNTIGTSLDSSQPLPGTNNSFFIIVLTREQYLDLQRQVFELTGDQHGIQI